MGRVGSYPTFSPLLKGIAFGRYISVALVLGLPPAGVTRYPCPMEPGLSSPGGFRLPAAAVQLGCFAILQQCRNNVKLFLQNETFEAIL